MISFIDTMAFFFADISDVAQNINADYGVLATIKLIALIVSLAAGLFFVVMLIRMASLRKNKISLAEAVHPPRPAEAGAYSARWTEIAKHIDSIREAEWKFAVIEADKLVDDILRTAGFPGETMGERLMSAEGGKIQNLQGLWEAHKTRNRLAHDTNYFLRHAEARQAITNYKATLKEFGAID